MVILQADRTTATQECVEALHNQLDLVLAQLKSSSDLKLPRPVRIAPNLHSWTETALVMGVPVKGKRKLTHTDAYSGGERSGNRSHKDAQLPRYVYINIVYI